MSISKYVKTALPFDFEIVKQQIDYLNHRPVVYEQRGETLYYFWNPGGSTRGVDLSLEADNWVEIRNTVCSTIYDYMVSNLLAEIICKIFEGTPYVFNDDFDEDEPGSEEYIPTTIPFFDLNKSEEAFINDCKIVRLMVGMKKECMTLYGPIREFYIGKRILEVWESLSDEDFAQQMKELILKVNYKLPDWELGHILQSSSGDDEKPKTIKVISNLSPYILAKYDYLAFTVGEGEVLLITNDNLNKILPEEWELVDEYNIVAPVISDAHFDELIERAKPFNKYNNF